MKQREQPEMSPEVELRARLSILKVVPEPNLQRGRARVLAAAQRRVAETPASHRVTFALAMGVGLAVVLLMVVMSSAVGALSITTVALTRTDTVQARTVSPLVVPANSLSPKSHESVTHSAARTPVPGVVPEPPRSPSLPSTQTLAP
jgi:hypothetical protein